GCGIRRRDGTADLSAGGASRAFRTAGNAALGNRGRLYRTGRTMASRELLMTRSTSAIGRRRTGPTRRRGRRLREANMSINLKIPDVRELKPRITVFGTGGAGGNAVNNMITSGLQGVDFVVANTDAQALTMSKAERIIQMGVAVTEGLGAGS